MAGQSVSVFSIPKLRKLMEEETLRLTAAAKLNLGLDTKLPSEEDNLPDVMVSRAQFKGMVKVLQAAFQGIETTWTSQSNCGLASTLALLEIAHTHYWARDANAPTPSSGIYSMVSFSLVDDRKTD